MSTPTAVTGQSTPYRLNSYISIGEFYSAPTAVDLSNLQVGGTAAEQDTRLAEVIARASSWADQMCGQILAATVDTEVQKIRPNRDGFFVVHTNNWPCIQVNSFGYGSLPGSIGSMSDLSGVFVEPRGFTVTAPGFGLVSSQGPLQFGPLVGGDRQYFCQYTYVNGYPNTLLATACNAGDQTVTVVDPTGIIANLTRLTIFDGSLISVGPPSLTERGLSVTGVTGSVVSLAAPLAYGHAAGTGISALPDAVKQAVILLTKTLIMTRGAEAITMDDLSGGPARTTSTGGIEEAEVAIAAELLEPFGRIR